MSQWHDHRALSALSWVSAILINRIAINNSLEHDLFAGKCSRRFLRPNLFDAVLQKVMSTLISELDSAPALGDGDFVQNILAEMNGGSRQVINEPSSNTAMAPRVMDNGPATAHVIGNQHPTPGDFAKAMNTHQGQAQVQASNDMGSGQAAYNTPAPVAPRPAPAKKSWLSRIFDEFRMPLLVTIIVFIFSLPVVNFLFAHYIPWMVLATGQLTTVGLLIKSLAAGSAFWIGQRVVIPLLSM